MLKQLTVFREKLDDIMCNYLNCRITLYGYGYTGRFIKWYAKYYHNIDIAYCIAEDNQTGIPYDMELFHDFFLVYNYKDYEKTVLWLAVPPDERVGKLILDQQSRQEVVDFYEAIYEGDYIWEQFDARTIYQERKKGTRDIQFMEYLEWKYGCNFLTMVDNSELKISGKCGSSYRATTQKELFPILDACHCIPKKNDALFDFGCGKGSVLICALDYGFDRVGGIEFEPGLFEVLIDNRKKLAMSENEMECFCGDAAMLTTQLDNYNWFYFWDPFGEDVMYQVVENLNASIERVPRKIYILYSNPKYYYVFEKAQYRLRSQLTIETRQRVVSIYENVILQ